MNNVIDPAAFDVPGADDNTLPDPNPTWESLAVSPDGVPPVAPAAHAVHAGGAPAGARLMPSGNWVQVMDAHALTRGDKRALIREASQRSTDADKGFAITDLLHRLLITAWSYPHPLPSQDPTSLEQLPLEDDDALDALIAEANRLMFPRPATPDDYADPASPTGPSSA